MVKATTGESLQEGAEDDEEEDEALQERLRRERELGPIVARDQAHNQLHKLVRPRGHATPHAAPDQRAKEVGLSGMRVE